MPTPSQSDKNWKSLLRSLGERRWEGIRNSWLRHIDSSTVSYESSSFLSRLMEEEELVPFPLPKGELTTTQVPRGAIPSLMFAEALRWTEKALHVLGAAEIHLETGIKSWSLSSSYQSAYFASRAVTSFLGVTIFEIDKISFVVNICENAQNWSPRTLIQSDSFSSDSFILSVGALLDQKHYWDVFKRVVETTRSTLWSRGWTNYIRNEETKAFSGCRHDLHYKLPFWPWDDLMSYDTSPLDDDVIDLDAIKPIVKSSSPQSTILLAIALNSMALRLAASISEVSKILEVRFERVRQSIDERHPLFRDNLLRHATKVG